MTFDAAPGYLSADDCRLADLRQTRRYTYSTKEIS
jgi:hypothetical protein